MPTPAVALAVALALAAGAPALAAQEVVELALPDTELVVEFVHVPAADIPAGEHGPARRVEAFWMARTELTWDLYDRYFLGFDLPMVERAQLDGTSRPSKPYGAVDRGFGHRGFPALGMTRKAADAFCEWFGAQTGHTVRLPSEDEWTLAAGGFDDATDDAPLAERAWFFDNANDRTHKVAKRAANARGLHDMLGNAAEWVAADPRDPERHVICGGSFLDFAEDVHPFARQHERKAWKATDPQIPKSRWWFKDGPFVGMRLASDTRPGAHTADASSDDARADDTADRDAAAGDLPERDPARAADADDTVDDAPPSRDAP